MRFLVENLPYYYDNCPFVDDCIDAGTMNCPRHWDKEFVCSDENPHCCRWMREEEVK